MLYVELPDFALGYRTTYGEVYQMTHLGAMGSSNHLSHFSLSTVTLPGAVGIIYGIAAPETSKSFVSPAFDVAHCRQTLIHPVTSSYRARCDSHQ